MNDVTPSPYERLDLSGRTLIVTGAARGIGAATARLLSARGANVVLADALADEVREVADSISSTGAAAIAHPVDVRDEQQVADLVARAVDEFGSLNGAFNNAGISSDVKAPMAQVDAAAWDRMFDINSGGVFLCMKHEIAAMLDHGGGAIVNTASAAGLIAMPNTSAYVASKHAVIGATRAAALDYATSNIRVNAIAPGVIQTPMADKAMQDPRIAELISGVHPIGRWGEAHEIAEAAAFLLAEASSFITGTTVVVDGGWTMV